MKKARDDASDNIVADSLKYRGDLRPVTIIKKDKRYPESFLRSLNNI